MKKHILDRYRRDGAGQRVVDIAAGRVNDLYDDFDKRAPFVRKELDYDLVEYLIESVRELRKEPFSIAFSFSGGFEPALEERVRASIQNYFDYLLAKNLRDLQSVFRKSGILLLLGAAMLWGSIYTNLALESSNSVVMHVMAEGLVVAAWVSLWEGIAGLLLNWHPAFLERRVYHRLKSAEISFVRPAGAGSTDGPASA